MACFAIGMNYLYFYGVQNTVFSSQVSGRYFLDKYFSYYGSFITNI